jgi:hypothetical protein
LLLRRKLLPRSGATLTFIPAAEGSDGGQVFLFGGQDPVAGVIFDDFLVSFLVGVAPGAGGLSVNSHSVSIS